LAISIKNVLHGNICEVSQVALISDMPDSGYTLRILFLCLVIDISEGFGP
jgi:hypothetical protein